MDTDSAAPSTLLEQMLPIICECKYSPAALRVAIQTHLSTIEEIQCLLDLIETWISIRCSEEDDALSKEEENEGRLPELGSVSLLHNTGLTQADDF